MSCSFSDTEECTVLGGLTLLFCGWLPWSGFGNMHSVMFPKDESWGLAHVETYTETEDVNLGSCMRKDCKNIVCNGNCTCSDVDSDIFFFQFL